VRNIVTQGLRPSARHARECVACRDGEQERDDEGTPPAKPIFKRRPLEGYAHDINITDEELSQSMSPSGCDFIKVFLVFRVQSK
jgi:hypothetical protein